MRDITDEVFEHREQYGIPKEISFEGERFAVHAPEEVVIFERHRELCAFVAERIFSVLDEEEGGVILPAGRTFEGIYEAFSWPKFKKKARKIFDGRDIASLDEVWPAIPGTENEVASFREYMRARFFRELGIAETQWIIPDGSTISPEEESAKIESQLQAKKWALALLGIGPDAQNGRPASSHIAFIPPNTSPKKEVSWVELDEAMMAANRGFFMGFTLGPADIGRAGEHVLVATGKSKKQNIARLLLEPPSLEHSSGHLLLYPRLTVVLDEEAAGEVCERLG